MSYNTETDIRNSKLIDLAKMVVDGGITYKLDFIAKIQINDWFFFNVFRRYNSPYNFVIEDHCGDVYLHQDYTVRKSLQTVLCLSDTDARNLYTRSSFSYKHTGPVPSLTEDLADLRWSEIQSRYLAVSVNFGGVYWPYPFVPRDLTSDLNHVEIKEEPHPVTPPNQITSSQLNNVPLTDSQAANALLSLRVPEIQYPFEKRESDGPTLSMRFADIQNRKRKREELNTCYCMVDEEDDWSDDESIDTNNYTVLRNGTMIPKLQCY